MNRTALLQERGRDAAGPPGQGVQPGRHPRSRGGQPVHRRDLSAGPQPALRQAAGTGGDGLRPGRCLPDREALCLHSERVVARDNSAAPPA